MTDFTHSVTEQHPEPTTEVNPARDDEVEAEGQSDTRCEAGEQVNEVRVAEQRARDHSH